MTTTLRTFLDERETAIKEQLKAFRAELAEIKVARQALDGVAVEVQSTSSSAGPTIKDMIRTVLERAPDGMTSALILEAIKQEFGRDVERTSLSPQLTRLKDAGEVHLVGENWFTWKFWSEQLDAARAQVGKQDDQEERSDGTDLL